MVQRVIKILSSFRFPLHNEKETQAAIAIKLIDAGGIDFFKEYSLDKENIPDFFIDGIAVEVKLKGAARKIYTQCDRYCSFPEVKSLILATNRSMGFPKEINGKPCYVVNLGKAWL